MRAACARVLSCRAEFSQRLDDEVGSLIAHVELVVVGEGGMSCCLPVRLARRPCRVVQSFPDGWTVR